MNAATSPVLEARHISRNFGAVVALADASIEVGRHEVLGLVGDNGAGKSTLLKILSGILPPSGGEIRLDGKPVDPVKLSPEQRRKYYEQKAKDEAAARAQASRKTQAADRAYRETFGGAGPNGTAGTEPDASGTSSGPSAGKPAEDSEDSPSLLEKTSNTWLRPDEDFTPPIEAQGSEPKTYK